MDSIALTVIGPRYGSGEAENEACKEEWESAERAAGGGEGDKKVKANKTKGNGTVMV